MSEQNIEAQPTGDMPETPASLEQIVRQRFASNEGFGKELQLVATALQLDDGYAWTWHSNLAVSIVDEGVDPLVANRAAARFMYSAFSVDITKNPNWESLMKSHAAYKESQCAGVSISADAVDAMSAIWKDSMSLQFIQSDMGRVMNLLVSGKITGNAATFAGLGVKLRKEKNLENFDPASFGFEGHIQFTYMLDVEKESGNMPGVTALLHARHYLMHEAKASDPTAPYLKSIHFKIDETFNQLNAVYTYGLQQELEPDAQIDVPYPSEIVAQFAVPAGEAVETGADASDPELQELSGIEDAAHREYLAEEQREGHGSTDQ